MMWDAELLFSNEQTLAAANSTNVVEIGPGDAGKGQPLHLQAILTDGASGDLTITLNTADVSDMTGAFELAKYKIDAERVAKGGVVFASPLPTGCKRFLQLAYSGATGGKITAGLVLEAHTASI